MKAIRRTLAAALLAGVTVVAAASPAAAITGGEPDGDRHPNVGLIAFYAPSDPTPGRFRCSATLVSPTVVLTAAHCTEDTLGKTLVTFETFIAEDAPSPLPVAADVNAGYTAAELEAAGYLSGTAYTHPEYSGFTDMKNWNDVGVVVLDKPVTTITPAMLAPTNYLDQFAQPLLNSTVFDLVGYGTEVRKAESGPQNPQPMGYPLLRRYTTAPGQKLTPQLLQLNGNENDVRGGGGTCFGDSGGPVFLNGYLVAVTSYGYTSNCRYLDGYQRVEIPVAQDWLAGFR